MPANFADVATQSAEASRCLKILAIRLIASAVFRRGNCLGASSGVHGGTSNRNLTSRASPQECPVWCCIDVHWNWHGRGSCYRESVQMIGICLQVTSTRRTPRLLVKQESTLHVQGGGGGGKPVGVRPHGPGFFLCIMRLA